MTCRSRHWYALGVSTGVQSPQCVRCGQPNPAWSDAKQEAYDEYTRPEGLPDGDWVRCYDIDGDPADEERAWCRTHQREVTVKTRGDKGPWHLYWRSLVNDESDVSDGAPSTCVGPYRVTS